MHLMMKLEMDDEHTYDCDLDGENKEIPENESKPCCKQCSLAFRTWAGYEYHVMKTHVCYRPYQCLGCGLMFYTESEGRFHLNSEHGGRRGFYICKLTNFEKEREALYFFQRIEFLKCEEVQNKTFEEQVPSSIYNFPSAYNVIKCDRVKFDLPKILKVTNKIDQESDNIFLESCLSLAFLKHV